MSLAAVHGATWWNSGSRTRRSERAVRPAPGPIGARRPVPNRHERRIPSLLVAPGRVRLRGFYRPSPRHPPEGPTARAICPSRSDGAGVEHGNHEGVRPSPPVGSGIGPSLAHRRTGPHKTFSPESSPRDSDVHGDDLSKSGSIQTRLRIPPGLELLVPHPGPGTRTIAESRMNRCS